MVVCSQTGVPTERERCWRNRGRDATPVPVMPEVAVHHDGGLRRPAQEAARPATVTASVRTALEAALPARVAQMFTPPPPPDFPAPLTRRTLPLPYASVARPLSSSARLPAPVRDLPGGCPSSSILFPPTPPASARTGHLRLERT